MKRLLSLVITMVMVVSMGMNVFSEKIGTVEMEDLFSSEIIESRVIMDNAVYKHLVDQYTERFFYSSELKQIFLDRVAQMEADNMVVDNRALRELYREIIQDDRERRMALASTEGIYEISSKEQPLIMNRSTSSNLYIDNPVFMSDFEGNTMVEDMTPGFMRSRFTVRNDNIEAKSIMAIVKLQSKDTNALQDVAIVDKVIAADTSETITAGFNVLNDAENYEIKITLWDNNMNLQADIITFPEPHAILTLSSGTNYFDMSVLATGNVVVEYNGKTDTYVSNGAYFYITVQELISTPIIIKGDLIGMLSMYNNVKSFNSTGLSNLTHLYLGGNQLSLFDGTGLSNLTDLDLGSNQLSSFDGTGLGNLSYLDLSWNQLSSFDGTGVSNLTHLYLGGNQLSLFDGTGLSNLTSLSLFETQLSSFDGTGFSKLTSLYLHDNSLTSFNAIGLSNLTYLDLSYNQLSSFDGTGFSNLTSLSLYGNSLTSFNAIGLSNLTSLYLNGNSLTSFNAIGLSNLSNLNLGYNQLSSFDGIGLSNLTNLNLSFNPNLSVVTIPEFEDVPSGSGGLRYLTLRGTALGSQSSINSVWNDIIDNLPTRNDSYKGNIYVSNTTLKTELQDALNAPTNKYWTVTSY